ncbi:glycosyltransferase [Acidiphilium sp.]|uniref:glycosyltransferase n=1 Tax=Acidiphilium sp. TaxID=527 RepID=UPI003D0713D2
MRWYFAIDEAGTRSEAGDLAKLAVQSRALCPGLEPRLLYHGARNDFTRWMSDAGVVVIDAVPPCLEAMQAATARGSFRAHSLGHWLRLAIPLIDHDAEFVLYTDCDIVFLRPIDFTAIRPAIFAAAPEFAPDAWNYFNAGVMVLNLAAMRAAQPGFEALIRARLDEDSAANFDDQVALNQAFRGHWDRLDPGLNAKPYWPHDPHAGILHFHGPKLGAIAAIAEGRWDWTDATARSIGTLCAAHIPRYVSWLTDLAERLQLIDMARAIQLHHLAGRLAAHGRDAGTPKLDLSVLTFRMFPD